MESIRDLLSSCNVTAHLATLGLGRNSILTPPIDVAADAPKTANCVEQCTRTNPRVNVSVLPMKLKSGGRRRQEVVEALERVHSVSQDGQQHLRNIQPRLEYCSIHAAKSAISFFCRGSRPLLIW